MMRRRGRSRPASQKAGSINYETVRELALALPEVEEGTSNGLPMFRVRGKLLARMQKDEGALLIKIDYFKRDILLHAEPDAFYITDFYRCHPMMFVRLGAVDRETLRGLIEEGWRLIAPKRVVEAYDSVAGGRAEPNR